MANYRLSAAAEDDLDRLYIYGVLSFGLEQTESYTAGLIDHFAILGDAPLLYMAVDEIRTGYRRSVYRAHSVYYRIDGNGVEIVRVLGREDRDTAFAHIGSVSEPRVSLYNCPQAR